VTRHRCVLVGYGQIGGRLAEDAAAARHYPYATHAQALRNHPAFELAAIVDHEPVARAVAHRDWPLIEIAAEIAALRNPRSFDVAILATPPAHRGDSIDRLPGLRAVVAEKPLATSHGAAKQFLESCKSRGIAVQVNLPRRLDETMRALASGGRATRIGEIQSGFAVYGNGIHNNGTHLVDWIRQIAGEITALRAGAMDEVSVEGPLPGDCNLPFTIWLEGGSRIHVEPLRFAHYREVGIELWGQSGVLALWHEGLTLVTASRAPNRALSGAYELTLDAPEVTTTTIGTAMRRLYDNLADVLGGRDVLHSNGENAASDAAIVEAILRSSAEGGRRLTRPDGGW
jgi:predicted dehydrogenase